jgi:hypothetical protein
MKAYRIPLIAALGIATAPVMAADVDLSLTNESVRGQFNARNTSSELQFGAGYTYHEGSRHILNADFYAQGRTAIGNLPATAGIGLRGIGWDDEPVEGGAIMPGGFATLNIPKVPGLSFTGRLHFAPSILSFGDSDYVTSLELRAGYRIIRNADIFAGYRYLNTDLEDAGDINLDKGVVAGMKLFF